MKKIIVTDNTIFSISKAGRRTAFKDRVEAARLLDNAGLDIIELSEFSGDKTEEILIKSIAAIVKNSKISVRVPLNSSEYAPIAAEALKNANRARLSIAAPVSAAQMEFVYHKKPAVIGETIKNAVENCRKYIEDVEFIAEDVLGGEFDVLKSELEAAISAGACSVTLSEVSGSRMPEEIAELVKRVKNEVEGIEKVKLSVACSNACGLGLACTMAGIAAGADGVKTSIDAELPAIAELAEIARQRANELGFEIGVNVTVLWKTVNKISWMLGTPADAKDISDTVSDKSTDASVNSESIESVASEIVKLGYELSPDDLAAVYEEIKIIAKKKNVGAKELEAVIATTALQVPPVYKLISFVINCGNVISSIAHIKLEKNGKLLDGICAGDGPIDAAFKAIEQIIGHHYELDDFQIQAVTEGREAVGSAIVKLRSEGKLYSGQGVSTDIIEASIRAYVNALNKIVYGEE